VQILAILFFLTVLTGAALGLWCTVRDELPLIVAALGDTARAPAPAHTVAASAA
jgi:hypothetical protein